MLKDLFKSVVYEDESRREELVWDIICWSSTPLAFYYSKTIKLRFYWGRANLFDLYVESERAVCLPKKKLR